jgi:hypothetical protein
LAIQNAASVVALLITTESRSLLHRSNRQALEAQGIKLITPAELVHHYSLQ